MTDHLQGILGTLPDKPSCYLRKDSGNRIILVGRAVNLRFRVRLLRNASLGEHNKTLKPVCKTAAIPRTFVASGRIAYQSFSL